MSHVLIVGCGDVGTRLGRLHASAGDTVTGSVRRESAAGKLQDAGITPVMIDLDEPDFLPPAGHFDIVYHLVPPPPVGEHDARTAHLLGNLPPFPRLVYMSTTSVYGNHGGAWVDESTPPAPTSLRGKRRLDAEGQVLAWGQQNGISTVILRVAAIYGPGRLPLDRLRAGAAAIRPDEATPTNRIHADDLAAVCFAAGLKAGPGEIYNCADGAPSSQAEYLQELAELSGLPPPRLVSTSEAENELSHSMLEFLQDSKRIRADRLKRDLGVDLRYPDFRSGLRASLQINAGG